MDPLDGTVIEPTDTPAATSDQVSTPARVALRMLERALLAAQPLVEARVRLRTQHPNATNTQLMKKLERTYVSSLTATGMAVGAAAAVPGAGTAAALALTAGDLSWFFTTSAVHVLSVLRVHDIELDDLEHQKAVVLTVLIGGNVSGATTKTAERTAPHLGKILTKKVPPEAINFANKYLGYQFVTRYGTTRGVLVLGRVFPFGIGAAFGATGNFLSAQPVIRGTRMAVKDALSLPDDDTATDLPDQA